MVGEESLVQNRSFVMRETQDMRDLVESLIGALKCVWRLWLKSGPLVKEQNLGPEERPHRERIPVNVP